GIRDFHVTGVQTCALPISFGGLRQGVVQSTQLDGNLVALCEHLLEALRRLTAQCTELRDALAVLRLLTLERLQSLLDLRLLLACSGEPALERRECALGACMGDAQLCLLVAHPLPCLLTLRECLGGLLPPGA